MTKKPSRRSVDEYHTEGMEQALRFFKGLGGTVTVTLTADDLRQKINELPDGSVLQTTMADFWLALSRDEGRDRRANEPPPNPFMRKGRNKLATKKAIAEWDVSWRLEDIRRYATRTFASSGAHESQQVAAHLRQSFPWLADDMDSLLGNALDMPIQTFAQAIQQPERLRVVQLTVGQAVLRTWADRHDQSRWVDRYAHAIRLFQEEVKIDVRT
jgi:hypothetical protein